MPDDRRGFHAYLSEAAYDGWIAASDEHRVSMTALAEVVGLAFASGEIAGAGRPVRRGGVR